MSISLPFGKKRTADYLPWWLMLSPDLDPNGDTITTRGGGLLRVAAVDPPDMESGGAHELAAYYRRLASIVAEYGRGWTLTFDQWRLRDTSYLPESEFGGCLAARLVDDACRRQFTDAERPVFTNHTFLAIHLLPQRSRDVQAWMSGHIAPAIGAHVDFFLRQSEALLGKLAHHVRGLRVLGGDALAAYLESTVSYRPGHVEMPRGILCKQLATQDWHTDEGGLRLGRDLHLATVEVRNFGTTNPLTVEGLQRLPHPSRFVTTYRGLSRDDRMKEVEALRIRWKALAEGGRVLPFAKKGQGPNQEAVKALAELERLEGQLDERPFCSGSSNIHVWGKTREEADERAAYVSTLFIGPKVERATLNMLWAPLGDMPGNDAGLCSNVRRTSIEVSALLRFAPVTGVDTGAREDRRFEGPALVVGTTRRGSPLFLPLNAPGSDRSHTVIIGTSGGGKSALMSRMASHFHRYERSRVALLDRKRSARITCLTHGGDWIELGAGGVGVQTLRFIDDKVEFGWASDWVLAALEMEGVTKLNTPGLGEALNEAMRHVADLPQDERTISRLWSYLSGSAKAADALNHYRAGQGPHGGLFDGVVRSYGSSRFVGIETYGIARSKVAPLVVAAVCHSLKRDTMNGKQPTLFMADEASFLLQDKHFGPWFQEFILEARKDWVAVVLATQSIQHFDGVASIILENAANTIYLPDPKLTEPEIAKHYKARGMSDELIRHIASGTQKREYFVKTEKLSKMVAFPLDAEALAICGASSDADHARADALLAAGFEPGGAFAREWVRESTAAWAARTGYGSQRAA